MRRSCQLTPSIFTSFPKQRQTTGDNKYSSNPGDLVPIRVANWRPDLPRLRPELEVELTQMMGSSPDDASMICRFSAAAASDQVIHSLFPPSSQAIRYEKNGHVASLKAFHVLRFNLTASIIPLDRDQSARLACWLFNQPTVDENLRHMLSPLQEITARKQKTRRCQLAHFNGT